MRHLDVPKLVPLAIAVLALTGMTLSWAEPPKEVLITVSEGKNCVVNAIKILCADVLKHLHDVVKLPAGSRVRVRAEKTSTYESTAKVFELLQKSEYTFKMGYVNVAEEPKE